MVCLLSWSLAWLQSNVGSGQGLLTSGWEIECVYTNNIVQPLRGRRKEKGKENIKVNNKTNGDKEASLSTECSSREARQECRRGGGTVWGGIWHQNNS